MMAFWRGFVAAVAVALAAAAAPAAVDDEAGVRRACSAASPAGIPTTKAFGDCLTDDVWFSEADDSFYKRFIGRDKVLGMFDYNIRKLRPAVGSRAHEVARRRQCRRCS